MNELFLLLALIIGARAYANDVPMGSPSALVQIEMFADYQCPFTKRGFENIKVILKDDALSSQLTIRHFPLDFHDQAKLAAKLAICSEEQNKFWEVSEGFFNLQSKGTMTEKGLYSVLDSLKIDRQKLKVCMSSTNIDRILSDDKLEAKKYKVMGTPYFIIHGPKGDKVLSGAYPVEEIKKTINEVL
jgi:protein-disulfide isomerase